MTVKELKAIIEDLPDETLVATVTFDDTYEAFRNYACPKVEQTEDGDWKQSDNGELALILSPFSDSLYTSG